LKKKFQEVIGKKEGFYGGVLKPQYGENENRPQYLMVE
jgi:hypothetical protein